MEASSILGSPVASLEFLPRWEFGTPVLDALWLLEELVFLIMNLSVPRSSLLQLLQI